MAQASFRLSDGTFDSERSVRTTARSSARSTGRNIMKMNGAQTKHLPKWSEGKSMHGMNQSQTDRTTSMRTPVHVDNTTGVNSINKQSVKALKASYKKLGFSNDYAYSFFEATPRVTARKPLTAEKMKVYHPQTHGRYNPASGYQKGDNRWETTHSVFHGTAPKIG
jgi:hypothetical protein